MSNRPRISSSIRTALLRTAALAAAVVCVNLSAAPAHAQGVIQAIGGVTSTADQHPVFGGMIGGKAGPIEIDVEGGHMQNIVPKRTADLARTLSAGTIRAELPAWYGMGSLRVLIVPVGPVQPFITGGLGFARLQPQLTSTSNNVNTTVVFGNNNDNDATKFLAGAGGGLRIAAGRAAIDAGYRYMRVFEKYRSDTNFNNDDVLVNVHMFYVGVGVKF